MRRELPPVTPENLYPRRLAARALQLVLERYGLGQMALKFNPDDPTQVLPGAEPGEVRFFADTTLEGHRSLARVYLGADGMSARVVVEQVRDLVRRTHRREFRPAELGIASKLDVEVDVAGVVETEGELMRRAPQRYVQRRRVPGAHGTISALTALRGGGSR
jgi:hypothetical protein